MELRPGYKQTEVGVIPEEWNVHALRNCLAGAPDYGINAPAVPFSDRLPAYIRITDITEEGRFSPEKPVSVNRADAGSYYLNEGDLVFARTGASAGKSYLYKPRDGKLVFAGFLIRVSPDPSKLVPSYLAAYVTTGAYWNWVRLMSMRSGQPGINGNEYGQLPIPLPPTIEEQRAIAGALGDVDSLMGALDKLIAKKRDIKQAAMQQLLNGKHRLPGCHDNTGYKQADVGPLPENWSIRSLKSVSTMHGRIGWQGLKQEEFTSKEDDPFLITGMNFKGGEIRWNEVYHIPKKRYEEAKPIQLRNSDILMTKDGTIGKILYIENIPFPGEASLNSHLLVFRPINESYVPKFLFYQLCSKRFVDYIDLNKSGTTFFGITQEAVGNYPAYLPPVEEQSAIATVLSDMDAEIAALEQKRDKTRALKQGMMQELLTGRTRLA